MGDDGQKSVSVLPPDEELSFILGERLPRMRQEDRELVCTALQFATQAHEGQKRVSGEPYVRHGIEVARIICDLRFDAHAIAAGLLHDIVEDTEFTLEDLRKQFPQPVCDLVDGVTKLSALQFRTPRERQVENLRKMMISMSRDIRVIVIKLCDRLHNMRTLHYLPLERRRKIARYTLDIYAPLANRLGMDRIKSGLEDLAMVVLYPAEHRHIDDYLSQTREERRRILDTSKKVVTKHLLDVGLKNFEVFGRSKHYYGIWRKMTQQNLPIEELCDLNALRVICRTTQNCYEIMGQIHALWPSVPGKFDDYISMPKKNGYRSIHTTVIGVEGQVTEIQIRTREMHQLNEEGIAAHWKYKEGIKDSDARLENRLVWLRRLIGWITEIDDPNEFLDSLKESVAAESTFCFTPQGDVIEMPPRATPLDFAFQIHTEVGMTCTGARVNGRIVPLRTTLKNGDMVEIQTSKNGHPSPGWLEVVQTGKARSKIRNWLKKQNWDEHVQHGKESLLRALKGRGGAWPWNETLERLEKLLPSLRYHSSAEVLMEIGFGSLSVQSVAERLIPPKREVRKARARGKPSVSGVVVAGAPGAIVRFAGCCAPIPGDAIVGYITIGRGVSIHKERCRSLAALMGGRGAGARLIDVEWDGARLPSVAVSFRVTARDRQGLLSDVTACIRDCNLSILTTTSRAKSRGGAEMRFQIETSGKAQLDNLIAALKEIDGVTGVDQISAKPAK